MPIGEDIFISVFFLRHLFSFFRDFSNLCKLEMLFRPKSGEGIFNNTFFLRQKSFGAAKIFEIELFFFATLRV